MFAVVKIAGQQFRVEKDQTLYVPHLGGEIGDKIELGEILLVDNDGKLSSGKDAKGTIKAEILSNVKGDKVIRKKHGHRTQYTQIRISSLV